MKKYRILERQGLFYIQIEVKQKKHEAILTGHIFVDLLSLYNQWRHRNDKSKFVYNWISADIAGGSSQLLPSLPHTTLDSAKKQIELWNTPDKIHEV